MRKKLIFRYFCLLCSIGIMVFIFLMSAQNSNASSGTSGRIITFFANIFVKGFKEGSDEFKNSVIASAQFFVRKFAHFSLFAALSFFVCGFFLSIYKKYFKNFIFSVLFTFFYACTDEIHQLFISGRSGEIRDVLIDLFGAILGSAFMLLIVYLFRRHKYENRRKFKQKR